MSENRRPRGGRDFLTHIVHNYVYQAFSVSGQRLLVCGILFLSTSSDQILLYYNTLKRNLLVLSIEISVTETITETEIIDPPLTKTETETMVIFETEII